MDFKPVGDVGAQWLDHRVGATSPLSLRAGRDSKLGKFSEADQRLKTAENIRFSAFESEFFQLLGQNFKFCVKQQTSHVQIGHFQRIGLNELAPRFDDIAHQRREHLLGLFDMRDPDLQ